MGDIEGREFRWGDQLLVLSLRQELRMLPCVLEIRRHAMDRYNWLDLCGLEFNECNCMGLAAQFIHTIPRMGADACVYPAPRGNTRMCATIRRRYVATTHRRPVSCELGRV